MEELTLMRQDITTFTDECYSTVEQPIDCDITLPDYLKDIQKILKCMAVPGISSVTVSGNRITAEGSATVRVLYLNEDNELSTYEQGIPFARFTETSSATEAVYADCKAKTGYMNCRAVNQRRIDVHGAVTLKFKTRTRKDTSVVTDSKDCCVEKRCCQMKVSNSVADAGRYFSVTETEIIKEGPEVESVVRTGAYALVNEVKVIKNKALIKGDLLITVGYISKESTGVEFYDLRMPISQIVDAVGLDENEIIDANLSVAQINVIPKADSSGEYKMLDISARLFAEMHAYKEMEFFGVTDAYSTKEALNLDIKEVPLLNFRDKINECIPLRVPLDIPEEFCQNILDVWPSDSYADYRFADGNLEIYGSITLSILAGDKESVAFFEKSLDYSYALEMLDATDAYCAPTVCVTGQNTVRNAEGGTDIRAEVTLYANVFERSSVTLVSDIVSSDTGCTVPDDGAAIIIYFAHEGENVWDIARRYNTTVGAVLGENDLDTENLVRDTMLLIPR